MKKKSKKKLSWVEQALKSQGAVYLKVIVNSDSCSLRREEGVIFYAYGK